jgi:squalene synthase HpnC
VKFGQNEKGQPVVERGTREEFASHLQQWGPNNRSSVSLTQAQQYCDQFTRKHTENFPVLSFAVPKPLRPHFAAIYTFCRWSDDLADEVGNKERSLELIDWWEAQLRQIYDSTPSHPVMIALQPTVERFQIPAEPFLDLLSAFRQDQLVNRYSTMAELIDYCRRSANPVGRLVLALLESTSPSRQALSDSICTGLQLTNFWQDVRRDYLEKDRIYVPADRLARYGLNEEAIAQPSMSPAWKQLLEELVAEADGWLVGGLPLVGELRGRFSIMTAMFAEGGRAILRRIRKEEYNVLSHRPVLRRWDKVSLIARSLAHWTRLVR